MKNRNAYIAEFREINKSNIALVGGKGANLGELSGIKGIEVPDGFCITTEAYNDIISNNKTFRLLLKELITLKVTDKKSINEASAKIRKTIEEITIPDAVATDIARRLTQYGEKDAYAVRSSATAEDLPTASFAGQQDSYLNITGTEAILQHISKCWASLFTERAVVYRLQNGFEHDKVSLSVVIQRMVFPQAAGILFTADPVSGHRRTMSIDASFGLGEALVAGLVNADNYKVQDGTIRDKKTGNKKLAVYAAKDGGTQQQAIKEDQQNVQVLADEQILQLEMIGRKIETHFGAPQDIEWCLADGTFYIVQSRPVTTLFPVPKNSDPGNHVYISVGHQQMMTDPMKPLGLSLWQLRAARPMFDAAGRLFVDVTDGLAKPADRENLLEAMAQHDPLIKDALLTIVAREGFIQVLPDDEKATVFVKSNKGMSAAAILEQAENLPSIVADLVRQNELSVEKLRQDIQTKSGTEVFDFILDDIGQSKKAIFDSQHMGVIIGGMNASSWLNDNMNEWVGEKNVADVLSQSVDNNVTSEMGLALLDVADVIRPYPEIITYLQQSIDDNFLEGLSLFEGGQEARKAIDAFLHKYGMRCAGEIDITKTRWSEKPNILAPLILGNIKNCSPGDSKRKFEQGKQEAMNKEQMLLDQLIELPGGEQKVADTKKIIGLLRNFAGYREYPKYGIVNRLFVYKQALLQEAAKLVQASVIDKKEEVYYLSFEEFREAVRTHKIDQDLIAKRKAEHQLYKKLTPPRVITSDGEIVTGQYNRDNLPDGAIAGLAVSSGIAEGRARIILNMESADIEEGDILVTSFTDPSWTPLFVSIKALVTEVGGMMTHGAVIAREYGLPAVVSVDDATKLIKEGQRIRVNGTNGYIEILDNG